MGQKRIIRVVLDTNVVISALLFGGEPGKLIKMWKEKKIFPLLSQEILDEYLRVLTYPKFQLTRQEIAYLLTEEILPWFEIIEIKEKGTFVLEDPEDDKFIHCALAGKADFLVSGDSHLLHLSEPPVPVVSVREFLKRIST